MERALIATAVIGMFAVVAANRPERRPGNLAPIQMISAVGAWALLLVDVSAMAIAIYIPSVILLCASGVTIAITLVLFVRNGVMRIAGSDAPQPVKSVVDETEQLLGGAPRLGMNSLDAVVVAGRCPGIGVTVAGQGRVVVRIRRDVVRWLERHQQSGGAGIEVIASFARFTVLHELAHVLNGDHRTFRFVRSVLVAHLVWLGAAVAAGASLVVDRRASSLPLLVAASVLLVFVAQSLVARRFIAERERLADWRAMQTLAPADAARLLERRGRCRAATNPTELEKLMIDLKTQTPSTGRGDMLSRLVALVWPEGDDVHRRAESVAGDRTGGPPRPVRWAALMGMQCGWLSMSLGLAALFAVVPWMTCSCLTIETLLMPIMAGIIAPALTYCELRIDPARMSLRGIKRGQVRVAVGLVFYGAFAAAAATFYLFYLRSGIVPRPIPFIGTVLVGSGVVIPCAWFSGGFGTGHGGGLLRDTPRSPWVQQVPVIVGLVLVLLPLSLGTTYWLALGTLRSGQWLVLAFMSFGAFVASTVMGRSTHPVLRAIAPVALLDTPAPVYGFRLFWLDFYVDMSRTTLLRAAAIAMAVQIVGSMLFVGAGGLLMWRMRTILSATATVVVCLACAIAAFALMLVIPDRYAAYRDPSTSLLDRGWLQIFEKLLAAARTASPFAAERLRTAIARWLHDERFPDAVLPDPHGTWTLAPLLTLVRLARETGETAVLHGWRDRLERSLRQIVTIDGVGVAPGQPPSLYWSTLAAAVIDEAELRDAFPFERMLDRIEVLLHERLTGPANLLVDVISAWQLLRRWGRAGPEPRVVRRFARSSSLVSRPLLRQSLAELCELAELTGDRELRERLALIIRSRSWEALQLNPRKDVLLVLDSYLASASLGETDPHEGAADVVVAELAGRIADELNAIAKG